MNNEFLRSSVLFRQFILAVLGLAVGAISLHAHSVWIEPNGQGQLVVRFAEPDGKLEKSPGYLDSLSTPIVFTMATNTPSTVEAPKKSDHFLLVNASPDATACAETSFTVRAARKPYFYARWQAAADKSANPLLTLDIVPTGKPGEARVYFRGQPLGGIKATLRSPDEKEQPLVADNDGFLHFKTEQSGQYLLTVAHHRETLPGFHLGVAYKETSHNAALTWRQP
ncbi:MAG TPA: hypothetical protein VHH73_06295 [Verrucomicrobiae bacterium]|nr:hypothetical protein [Verrucomicrobiae bacterium]